MVRVLLVRHGETDYNQEGILQGQRDVPLNDEGVEQAEKLAERLAREEVDAVYSSDLERASKTAEIIARGHGLEPEKLKGLRERSYGGLEGEPHEARREEVEYADQLDAWRPEGGESMADITARSSPLLEDIREEHAGGTVVVVAHGWVNRALILSAMGAERYGHRIRQGNACINEFEHEEYRGWRINRVNDTAHLE